MGHYSDCYADDSERRRKRKYDRIKDALTKYKSKTSNLTLEERIEIIEAAFIEMMDEEHALTNNHLLNSAEKFIKNKKGHNESVQKT